MNGQVVWLAFEIVSMWNTIAPKPPAPVAWTLTSMLSLAAAGIKPEPLDARPPLVDLPQLEYQAANTGVLPVS